MSAHITKPAPAATPTLPAPGFGAFIARVTAKVPMRRKAFEPGDRCVMHEPGGVNHGKTVAVVSPPDAEGYVRIVAMGCTIDGVEWWPDAYQDQAAAEAAGAVYLRDGVTRCRNASHALRHVTAGG